MESSNMKKYAYKVVCTKCDKSLDKPLNCARCMGVHYCSKECQQNDWSGHKQSCRKLKKDSYDAFLATYFEAERYSKEGNFAASEGLCVNSLQMAESIFHSEDVRIASPLVLLGQIKQERNKAHDAIDCFERAYNLYVSKSGSTNMHVLEVTMLLINSLLSVCSWEKACTYAELNYSILIDFEGECTCYLIAETARQLATVYKEQHEDEKSETMLVKAIDHYAACPDLETRSRVDANFAAYGGYRGLLGSHLKNLRERLAV